MENLLRLIQSLNDMYAMPDFDIEELMSEAADSLLGENADIYAPYGSISPYLPGVIENAEGLSRDIKNIVSNDIRLITDAFIDKREKIYENINFADDEVIHRNDVVQNGFYSDLRTFLGDNSENFEDNNYFTSEKNNFIHNNKEFKEIYDYAESLVNGGDSIENNSRSSTVNIELGGVTQNITEANCDRVLEELGEMLLRTLSGCEGVY